MSESPFVDWLAAAADGLSRLSGTAEASYVAPGTAVRGAAQDPVRLSPAEVAAIAVRFGHWTPEAAQRTAEAVPVYQRAGEQGFGGFWPGPRTVGGDVGRIEVDKGPTDQRDLRIEHELRHGWDWTHPGMNGYDDAAVKARMAALGAMTDSRYATAEQYARNALADHGADTGHLHHYLIRDLGFDYNQLPPDYRATDFAQGDTSYRTPAPVNPFGERHRYVLPLVPR